MMAERKTRKVLDINENGLHIECIKHYDEATPYRLYKVWWNGGWHRRELTRYAELKDVLWHIAQMTIPYTTLWHQYKDIG